MVSSLLCKAWHQLNVAWRWLQATVLGAIVGVAKSVVSKVTGDWIPALLAPLKRYWKWAIALLAGLVPVMLAVLWAQPEWHESLWE